METKLDAQISDIRMRYGLSLAQFGSLVGAPATSIKRWEEGVAPREQFFFQLHLVIGLIQSPDEIFFDLARQGVDLNKAHWDIFASLIKGAGQSIEVAGEIGLDSPEVGQTLVTGVRGLLTLIAGSFAARNALGEKLCSSLATRIAAFLK